MQFTDRQGCDPRTRTNHLMTGVNHLSVLWFGLTRLVLAFLSWERCAKSQLGKGVHKVNFHFSIFVNWQRLRIFLFCKLIFLRQIRCNLLYLCSHLCACMYISTYPIQALHTTSLAKCLLNLYSS